MAPRYLRFARVLALGALSAGCASSTTSVDVADARDDAASTADTATAACDLDAESNQHYLRIEGPDVFARSCPLEMPVEGTGCTGCVWCNYDLLPTGECWCSPESARWRCNARMNTQQPPDLPRA